MNKEIKFWSVKYKLRACRNCGSKKKHCQKGLCEKCFSHFRFSDPTKWLKHRKQIYKWKEANKEKWRGIVNKACGVYWKKNQERLRPYQTVHAWVYRHLGKAIKCEDCKLDKIPRGKKRYFQWSNISHEYKRELTDWRMRCIPCHLAYDNAGDNSENVMDTSP